MNTNKKIAIGLGVAGAALLATWLLTGTRKQKTKDFVAKAAKKVKDAFGEKGKEDESDVHYV
jgi:type VI protein secretion system component VasK